MLSRDTATRKWFASCVLYVCLLVHTVCAGQSVRREQSDAPPKSPVPAGDTLKHFELAPGLRIELMASEPQVIDPIAVRFDEDGRMWVVEMRDYPHGPATGEMPKSRIKILQDQDGNGRFETVQVFADQLLFATGVQPWNGGAFVTLAGQVAYLKDTDGDGRADHSQTWYTGFAQENSQLRANHPRFALDNHVYIANGLRGGSVVDARKPNSQPISISGMDFRFNPLTRWFEAVSGVGQFGLAFDDYGNRFMCSNRNPLKHIVLEDRYLKRNPLVAVPAVFHDVATADDQSRVFPITRSWTTSNLHAGQFTAACGVEIYRGDALPAAFYGNSYTCEPTGHLVHREILTPQGATFTGRPAREGVEMLASRDSWFSPVNLETGPDGALWVVDMYRAVIEHPQFMPAELKQRPDLLDGNDRGRIYRIVAARAKRNAKQPRLSTYSSQQLAEQLEHVNSWWRETAARLLIERYDRSIGPQLKKLAVEGQATTARIHALWLLSGLGLLSQEVVAQGLRDPDARVRQQAVILSERWLGESAALRQQVRKLAGDEDPRVRFQMVLSLTPAQDQQDAQAIRLVAERDLDDPWARSAVTVAAGHWAARVASPILHRPIWSTTPVKENEIKLLSALFTQAGAQKDQHHLLLALKELGVPMPQRGRRSQRVALSAFAQSLARGRLSIDKLLDQADDQQLVKELELVFVNAVTIARDIKASDAHRSEAIQLLALDKNYPGVLTELALEDLSQGVRRETIRALARRSDVEPWRQLLAGFSSESPAIRSAILDGLLASTQRTAMLLDGVASGQINAFELDQARTNRLLKHRDTAIQKRAKTLLAAAIPEAREKVLAEYQVALKMKSNPHRGREVFQKHCATCHRVAGIGVDVAPDISDSRRKTPIQILTDILQPNRAIDSNYLGYSVVTTDGRVLSGILVSETATSVTLKQPEGISLTLLRDEIDELRSTGVSLMPVGLEKNIPLQDMADLVSFVKNWRYLDGQTPFEE